MIRLMTAATMTAILATTTAYAGDKPLVMVRHTIKDVKENRNQPLVHLLIPEGWKAESDIKWTLASIMMPHSCWSRFTSPDGLAMVEFPSQLLGGASAIPGGFMQGNPGPKDANEALILAVKTHRPGVRFEVVKTNSNKMTAEKISNVSQSWDQTASLVIRYSAGKREIEEEFTGDWKVIQTEMQGFVSRQWFIFNLRAIQADQGKLAEIRPIGVAMARSAKPTPEFLYAVDYACQCAARVKMHDIMMTKFEGEMWRKTNSEINDTWRKTCEERWASQQRTFEQRSDLLGGVNRYKNTNGDDVLLPHSHKYAWEGPNNTFLLTNDPSFRPETTLRGTWNPMKLKFGE